MYSESTAEQLPPLEQTPQTEEALTHDDFMNMLEKAKNLTAGHLVDDKGELKNHGKTAEALGHDDVEKLVGLLSKSMQVFKEFADLNMEMKAFPLARLTRALHSIALKEAEVKTQSLELGRDQHLDALHRVSPVLKMTQDVNNQIKVVMEMKGGHQTARFEENFHGTADESAHMFKNLDHHLHTDAGRVSGPERRDLERKGFDPNITNLAHYKTPDEHLDYMLASGEEVDEFKVAGLYPEEEVSSAPSEKWTEKFVPDEELADRIDEIGMEPDDYGDQIAA
jgi:hypothetical protein